MLVLKVSIAFKLIAVQFDISSNVESSFFAFALMD